MIIDGRPVIILGLFFFFTDDGLLLLLLLLLLLVLHHHPFKVCDSLEDIDQASPTGWPR